jgi:hypothetical protein
MAAKLNEEQLLAHFDRLVDNGMVIYDTDHETVSVSDQGLLVRLNPPCAPPVPL